MLPGDEETMGMVLEQKESHPMATGSAGTRAHSQALNPAGISAMIASRSSESSWFIGTR